MCNKQFHLASDIFLQYGQPLSLVPSILAFVDQSAPCHLQIDHSTLRPSHLDQDGQAFQLITYTLISEEANKWCNH
jgi:hypothetical protein